MNWAGKNFTWEIYEKSTLLHGRCCVVPLAVHILSKLGEPQIDRDLPCWSPLFSHLQLERWPPWLRAAPLWARPSPLPAAWLVEGWETRWRFNGVNCSSYICDIVLTCHLCSNRLADAVLHCSSRRCGAASSSFRHRKLINWRTFEKRAVLGQMRLLIAAVASILHDLIECFTISCYLYVSFWLYYPISLTFVQDALEPKMSKVSTSLTLCLF